MGGLQYGVTKARASSRRMRQLKTINKLGLSDWHDLPPLRAGDAVTVSKCDATKRLQFKDHYKSGHAHDEAIYKTVVLTYQLPTAW